MSTNQNTNSFITNEMLKNIKHYSIAWVTISSYFLIIPVGLNLLRAKTIHSGIEKIVSYPIGVINIGLLGGMYGFVIGVKMYEKEVIPKLDHYITDIISKGTDELYSYTKIKIDEITKNKKY